MNCNYKVWSIYVSRLLNSRIPFISVPLPTSADDHQLKNAMYYKKSYSYLVEEKDLKIKLKICLYQLIKIENY